jgi:hypothetical protein
MTMGRIGLTFDDFIKLRLPVERVQMFPMDLAAVACHLRMRGYDCRPEMLDVLIRNQVVTPVNADTWSQADVDAAAEHFEACDMLAPYAAMCQTLGCRYADFLRALREAAERALAKYGRDIPADDQYFVLHRQPPRVVTGTNGSLAGITAAIITFTLCDDIRERLERGEEV